MCKYFVNIKREKRGHIPVMVGDHWEHVVTRHCHPIRSEHNTCHISCHTQHFIPQWFNTCYQWFPPNNEQWISPSQVSDHHLSIHIVCQVLNKTLTNFRDASQATCLQIRGGDLAGVMPSEDTWKALAFKVYIHPWRGGCWWFVVITFNIESQSVQSIQVRDIVTDRHHTLTHNR